MTAGLTTRNVPHVVDSILPLNPAAFLRGCQFWADYFARWSVVPTFAAHHLVWQPPLPDIMRSGAALSRFVTDVRHWVDEEALRAPVGPLSVVDRVASKAMQQAASDGYALFSSGLAAGEDRFNGFVRAIVAISTAETLRQLEREGRLLAREAGAKDTDAEPAAGAAGAAAGGGGGRGIGRGGADGLAKEMPGVHHDTREIVNSLLAGLNPSAPPSILTGASDALDLGLEKDEEHRSRSDGDAETRVIPELVEQPTSVLRGVSDDEATVGPPEDVEANAEAIASPVVDPDGVPVVEVSVVAELAAAAIGGEHVSFSADTPGMVVVEEHVPIVRHESFADTGESDVRDVPQDD